MRPTEWSLLVVLSVLWGGSFFCNAIALKELPVFTVVVSRLGIASLILLLVLALTGRKFKPSGELCAAFLAMGLLNNAIPFSLIVWGQTHVSSALAAILNATTPLFTVVVAHVATPDEKLTRQRACGAALGFAGVVVIMGADALRWRATDTLPEIACLAAAFSYASAGVFGRRFKAMGRRCPRDPAARRSAPAAALDRRHLARLRARADRRARCFG
jgi:drug/metabolite transporter (DMT)-like permease